MFLLTVVSALASTVTLTNNPHACTDTYETHPLVGEEDNLAAAKLTPPSYPATVTAVSWRLAHGTYGTDPAFCDAGLAYEVLVFKGYGTTPPSTPTILETITVAAASLPSYDETYTFSQTLSSPITLNTGEKLYVAVRMTGDPEEDVVCVSLCKNTDWRRKLNFWSNSADAPYPWSAMEDYFIYKN